MTLLKDLIDIPEHIDKGQFVLRLTEGVTDPRATVESYVPTPQLVRCFDDARSFVRGALQGATSKATYLHGSIGSGWTADLRELWQRRADKLSAKSNRQSEERLSAISDRQSAGIPATASAGLIADKLTADGSALTAGGSEFGGSDDARLIPLLACLLELLPWLKQWHNEPDPAFDGLRMGDYFEGFVNEEARQLNKTVPEIKAWTPPARPAGRGRRKLD